MIASNILTLRQVLQQYIVARDIKPISAKQLHLAVNGLTTWYESTHQMIFGVDLLTDQLLGEWLFWLRDEKKNCPRTLNGKRDNILTIWRWGASRKRRLIPRRSYEPIRFREAERIPTSWTLEELALLWKACQKGPALPGWDGRHWLAIALVFHDTAFRLTACLSLKRSELRADGSIMAPAETQKPNRDEAKFLHATTLAAIRALPVWDNGDDRLFPYPYKFQSFWLRWKQILKSAELPASRRDGPQKLRRTSASHLESVAPGTATRHLGHRSGELARRHYLDPRIASPIKAAEIMPRPTLG